MAVTNHNIISIIWCLISTSYYMSHAFTIYHKSSKTMPYSSRTSTILNGGVGTASTYTWNEEQFEIEVKLTVPPKTTTKDIKFKCSSQSIDLRLLNCANDNDNNNDGDGNNIGEKILLDGSRLMRGQICVDGTFWAIDGNIEKERTVTITIEKHIVPLSSSGGTETYDTLTDFDWGGLYPNDEDEVTYRKYDEAEELNVKEYAAKLGVDIDNIDMSKVNKTMFGSGLGMDAATNELENELQSNNEANNEKGFNFNITQSTLEQLTKVGFATEVVQQGDGTEYELSQDGSLNEDSLFSMLGKDVSNDELREAGIVSPKSASNIPPMWELDTIPVEEAPGYRSSDVSNDDGIIGDIVESEIVSNDSVVVDTETVKEEDTVVEAEEEEDTASDNKQVQDPIDSLTVVRLKEILREQGLKVSGTKAVLVDRLKSHVNTLLQEE